ncbi:sigma-70 family RNA polymerase sigma factor [Dyella sp. 2RAB6]|uniref:sigma-70 family RNA polymerase sigma factor n=1 Tax=Dyella sp. 2RAB6 TaxID=3232992 RepID=UPI003F9185CE
MAAMPYPAEQQAADPGAELWARWCVSGDLKAREALLAHYVGWARKLARAVFMRVRGRSADWPDYVQNASIGLIEAIDAFDYLRGVPFEAYARQRVRGAVFNGLRALAATHEVRELVRVDSVDSLLEDADGDPVERLVRLVTSLGAGYALSVPLEPEHTSVPTPYDEAVRHQLGERIHRHLARLPERERLILQLHYLQHMAFVEIALALALTKGRISQLHRQGLERLRSLMQADAWQFVL